MTKFSTPQKPRWMAIWLPRLPTDRLSRAGAAPSDRPFALYAKTGNAFSLTAVSRAAAKIGMAAGMALADARAMHPALIAQEADATADDAALDRIGAWCERFTPIVVLDPPDGLALDISGCAHLFGSEAELLTQIEQRLTQQGFAARAAIAPNPAAAWALARFKTNRIATETDLAERLAPLPVAALRLPPEASALLKRLGLRTIGQVMHAPRAPFSARTGQEAMRRLDEALGRARQALSPRRPPPPVFVLRRVLEPLITLEAILTVTGDLCADLSARLNENGIGARLLRLSLFGVDGQVRRVEIGTTLPEQRAANMLRLLQEKLQRAAENFDAAFGFEAFRLDAAEVAPITLRATDLAPQTIGRDAQAEAALLDRLTARLGPHCIGKLAMRDTHAPERVNAWSESPGADASPPQDGVMRRPLTLFAHPQLIEAMASVPDGPPLRFRWRRVLRQVVRAEGPERIAPNWLRAPQAQARDYYRVEDESGRRYWVYRDGAYSEGAPRWFLHGLFA